MAKKKQRESVATGSDRVLRQRKSTTGDDTVDGKGKGKMTLEVEEEVKKSDSVVKGSLKTAKGKIDVKRKVVAHEDNAEIVFTSTKKTKNDTKNEKEKGGVTVSTRKLRSASKKEDEDLNEKAAGKENTEIVGTSMKKTENHNKNEKGKGGVSVSTRNLRSASKKEDGELNEKGAGKEGIKEGKKVVKKNTTPKAKIDKDIVEGNGSSASKVKEIAEKKGKQSVTLEATGKAQKSSVPAEKVGVTTRSAKKAQLELQKVKKGKKIVKKGEINKETTSDVAIPPISGILKNPAIDIGIPMPKTKLLSEIYAEKDGKFMGDQSENAKKKGAHDASSSKAVRNQVSKTKKDGGQGSVEVRRNPARKTKLEAESKK